MGSTGYVQRNLSELEPGQKTGTEDRKPEPGSRKRQEISPGLTQAAGRVAHRMLDELARAAQTAGHAEIRAQRYPPLESGQPTLNRPPPRLFGADPSRFYCARPIASVWLGSCP